MGEVLKAPPIVAELLGNVLEGRYRVDAVLAIGGMSFVFRGHHLRLNRDIAIKVMDPDLGPGASTRFLREAESAARLDHPNCITVHDFGVTSTELSFMVMPLLEGQTLRVRPPGRWDAARATRLVVEILRGLDHAHSHGVIHRDLKPENVFMAVEQGGTKVAKIVDFGLAKVIRGSEADSTTTMTGLMAGTPAYMSPEQALGMVVDERADLYSVGMILYELLAGELPFAAEDGVAALRMQVHEQLPALPADVPVPLAAIVAQLTAKERDLRPASAREVLDALEAFLRGDGHTMLAPAVRRPTPQLGNAYPAIVSDDATPSPGVKPSRSDVTWSDRDDAPRRPVRARASRAWMLWVAAAVAATSAVTVVTLTLAQPPAEPTTTATAEPETTEPPEVDAPSDAKPDASKLLALVNDPELAAREGWTRRHELLETIGRLEASAEIDTHLQVSLDLLQAAQSSTPCRTFAAALDAITLGGAASYTDVLRQARVPEGAADQPDCAPLAQRLERLQGSDVVIVESSDVPEDAPEPAKPTKKAKAKTKVAAKSVARSAATPAAAPAAAAEPAKPKKSLIPKLDDDLRPPT